MGHFSVSDFVTRLDIPHGKAGIIPLIKSKYTPTYGDGTLHSIPISDRSPYAFYHPFTLPIWGRYNEYGELVDIIENENTRILEKHFNMLIQEFVNRVINREDKEEDAFTINYKEERYETRSMIKTVVEEKNIIVTACWLTPDTYKTLSNYQTLFGEKPSKTVDIISLDDFVLDKLGFVFQKKDENRERYNRLYKHPDLPSFKAWSNQGSIEQSIYHPSELKEYLKNSFDYDLDISMFDNITKHHIIYDRAVKKALDKRVEFHFMSEEWCIRDLSDDIYLYDGIAYFDPVKEIYGKYIFAGNSELREEFVSWLGFYELLFYSNIPLMPNVFGIQGGEWHSKARVAAFTLKSILDKMKSFDKDQVEDNCSEEEKDYYLSGMISMIQEICPEFSYNESQQS